MKTNQNLSDNILVIDSLPALKYIFDRESTINHSDQVNVPFKSSFEKERTFLFSDILGFKFYRPGNR